LTLSHSISAVFGHCSQLFHFVLFNQLASNMALNEQEELHGQEHPYESCNFSLLMVFNVMMSNMDHSYNDQVLLCLCCSQICHFEAVG
jgi:hypothetical protein